MAHEPEEVTCLGFNQDRSCLTVGLTNGFRIFNIDPFQELYRHEFDDGGVGVVEMLFRTNILALVGCAHRPQFPLTNLVIWDNVQQKPAWELKYKHPVKAVKLQRDRMLVVVHERVIHYAIQGDFTGIVCTHHVDTGPNKLGLCSMSIAYPAFVSPMSHDTDKYYAILQTFADGAKRDFTFHAHQHEIECLGISDDGTLVATASNEGRLVRIFEPRTSNKKIMEFARGSMTVSMLCLSFSPDKNWVACISDKGTLHLFSLNPKIPNPVASLSRKVSSIAQYYVDELKDNPSYVVNFCFSPNSKSIYIATEVGMRVCDIIVSAKNAVTIERTSFPSLRLEKSGFDS